MGKKSGIACTRRQDAVRFSVPQPWGKEGRENQTPRLTRSAIRRIQFRRSDTDTPVAWSVNPFRSKVSVVVDFVITCLVMLKAKCCQQGNIRVTG
jgi:hypothetical protein